MARPASQEFVWGSIQQKPWEGPVIDLGAGYEGRFYKQYFGNAEYVQLDRKKQPGDHIDIVADLLDMPQVKSASYGVVLLLETLEHVYDPFIAFKEAARILRPRGLFICTTVACWPIHRHPKDYWRFLPDGLVHLCLVSGLTPYYLTLGNNDAKSPSHCCVAAQK